MDVQKQVKVQHESLQAISERVKRLDAIFASLSQTVSVHMERLPKSETRIDPLLHDVRLLEKMVQQIQSAQKELSLTQVVSSDGGDPHMVQAESAYTELLTRVEGLEGIPTIGPPSAPGITRDQCIEAFQTFWTAKVNDLQTHVESEVLRKLNELDPPQVASRV